MSVIGFSSNPDDKFHTQIRKWNVSGELDVFEATRYFSEFNEPNTTESRIHSQKQSTIITEQRQNRVFPETEEQIQRQNIIVEPPPISRGGGKLACFLTSLLRSVGFKRTHSTAQSQNPEGRWRRRSMNVVATPISGACRSEAPARRSFDDKHVTCSVLVEEQSLDRWRCEKPRTTDESLCLVERVRGKSGMFCGEVDDGCESDSSSDLFELNLYEK